MGSKLTFIQFFTMVRLGPVVNTMMSCESFFFLQKKNQLTKFISEKPHCSMFHFLENFLNASLLWKWHINNKARNLIQPKFFQQFRNHTNFLIACSRSRYVTTDNTKLSHIINIYGRLIFCKTTGATFRTYKS